MESRHYPFSPITLPYTFGSLEPYIDEKTVDIHFTGHYYTYLNNLNEALEPYPQYHGRTLETLIRQSAQLPSALQQKVLRNAGGVYNHELYFCGITNYLNSGAPSEKLQSAIDRSFAGTQGMFEQMKKFASEVFGSGYVFLACDRRGALSFVRTANQDTLLKSMLSPILTLDLWEHAYYLKHFNKRQSYIDDWFNIINWEYASLLYLKATEATAPHNYHGANNRHSKGRNMK